jgi:hypothetical protein
MRKRNNRLLSATASGFPLPAIRSFANSNFVPFYQLFALRKSLVAEGNGRYVLAAVISVLFFLKQCKSTGNIASTQGQKGEGVGQ